MTRPPRRVVIVEIAAMSALILSYTWLWNGAFRGDFLVCVALYLGIGISSHARRGETAREIGLRSDNAWIALRQAALFVGPIVAVVVLVGAALGTLRPAGAFSWPIYALGRIAWGTLQQYGLLAFFYRRVGELTDGTWKAIFVTAGFFALFHLPNPFLVPVTFATGVVSCWIYRKAPNIWVMGLMHAALGMALARSLPYEITFGMRVGPGFFGMLASLRDSW